MGYIDKIDWHSGGDFPEELPYENGGTHIGFYIQWIIENDLIGEFLKDESDEALKSVLNNSITGRDFLIDYCDGKFWDECLNQKGLEFTNYYYEESDSDYNYLDEYSSMFDEYETIYHIENSNENYLRIKERIDEVYNWWVYENQSEQKVEPIKAAGYSSSIRNKHLIIIGFLILINFLLSQLNTYSAEEVRRNALSVIVINFSFIGFILGAIFALFPYKNLKYSRRYLRASLITIIVLQGLMFLISFSSLLFY